MIARIVLCVLALSVCALASIHRARAQVDLSSLYADPAKYTLYGCKQLAEARPLLLYRIRKLEGLMAKASDGAGGGVASSMAYRNDYLTARGDLQNLDARAADRSCPPLPQQAIAPPNEAPLDEEPARRKNSR